MQKSFWLSHRRINKSMLNKHQIMIKVIKPDENNYKILNHNSTDLHEISTNYDIHFNSHFNSEV